MNSRQRVEAALNHQQPDHVPLDLGASAVTGMHVSSVVPAAPGAGARPARHAGQGGRAVPDARRDRPGPARRPGRRRGRPGRPEDDVRLREQGLEAVDALRRHAGAGARRLQHRARAQRRHPHVSRGRPLGPAQRPHAQGRLLLRHHRPPGADRRRQAQRRGQPGGVRPGHRRRPRALRARGRPAAAREPTRRSWPTSAARPSATSPWCPPRG